MARAGFSFEVVIVNDGSRDETARGAARAGARSIPSSGSSPTAASGASPTPSARAGDVARGDVFVFYPADLQYLPDGHSRRWWRPILEGRADIVTGTKQGKYEKAFVSRIYNGLCRWLFGVQVDDLNSVKA